MQPKSDSKPALGASTEWDRSWRELVAKHIASLRFGVVQIVVHDSRVVQIERTEKVRLDRHDTAQ